MCRVIFRSCYSLMPAANPSTTFVSSWRVFSSASTTCSGAFNEKEKCRRDSQAKRFSQTDREVYDSVGAIRHCVPFVRNPTSDQHWRRSSFFMEKFRKACPRGLSKMSGAPCHVSGTAYIYPNSAIESPPAEVPIAGPRAALICPVWIVLSR